MKGSHEADKRHTQYVEQMHGQEVARLAIMNVTPGLSADALMAFWDFMLTEALGVFYPNTDCPSDD